MREIKRHSYCFFLSFFFLIADVIAGSRLPIQGQIPHNDCCYGSGITSSLQLMSRGQPSWQKTEEKNSKSSLQSLEAAPSHFPFTSPRPNLICLP